jgi:hypothetical protein
MPDVEPDENAPVSVQPGPMMHHADAPARSSGLAFRR